MDAGIGFWLLHFLDRGQICIYCGFAAVNTNLDQSSLGLGLLMLLGVKYAFFVARRVAKIRLL